MVEQVLAGVRPHLMVTDPPYGVDYDPAWRNAALAAAAPQRTGKVLNDHRADWREAWALFPGEVAYVWHGALHAATVAESLTACGFDIRAQIIWAKERLVMGRGHYHWQHEPCWYAVRGRTGHWSGDRKQTTLWQIASRGQDAETTHGTQKPVECMRRPIENNSSPGQAVYEPFCGSGTTLIAAEMAGRACHAIELSPAYVDVAVLRWQAFTGETGGAGRRAAASFAARPRRSGSRRRADEGVVRADRRSSGGPSAPWPALACRRTTSPPCSRSTPRRCASTSGASWTAARSRRRRRWRRRCSAWRPAGKNVAAAIFWMKARAGWREKQELVLSARPVEMSDEELAEIVQQGRDRLAIEAGDADPGEP